MEVALVSLATVSTSLFLNVNLTSVFYGDSFLSSWVCVEYEVEHIRGCDGLWLLLRLGLSGLVICDGVCVGVEWYVFSGIVRWVLSGRDVGEC